ncbi:MAG TPA: saccharopine dehydrogenase NADP-binding domain-containing protein [Sphingopyxis sp.]|uniref:saccharopine dehydrogenase family protein n=1 Tax=Sphingopyxis sp. TaxID=1908224 RepID=UPI002CBB7693|nr:saccharopine dehydrogenase NADP-binding domain-containing protein [Sphingopyxis sp.]HWW59324.1 saccharopine dehydrogenase NADP-binding domain-containing protein [Sphingopyxis sp.]
MPDLRVLVIGATGVFGSRLAELAAREPRIALTLAARDRKKLETLAARLGGLPVRALDRKRLVAPDLAGFDVVIDAAGPFQASAPTVIEAAVAAGVHYVDLADGRAFVAAIGRHDADARAAGVSVTTGASSIPALSHAAIDTLTDGWRRIDRIRIGIFPGNRAPRGLAVVQAILSYVGHPARVWREARWTNVPGWGMTHRWTVPGVGTRWASVCDTPEQDLLVQRYRPQESAEFFAGMELSILHLGLALLAFPVRRGWIASLGPAARPLLAMAKWLLPFGSDVGAMDIVIDGRDAGDKPREARWTLRADGNRGPYVPTLAALAMLRRFRDGRPPAPGARACTGLLTLAEWDADFERLGITTHRV